MSTPATSQPQPAADAPATLAADTPAPTGTQSRKFDGIQKSVAGKARGFIRVLHSTGEQIRGHINAALDGAGDAIAGRKPGEVKSKSGDPSRRSMGAADSEATPAVPATTTIAPETNAESQALGQENREKRAPVGQFINTSLKRTYTLVAQVGGNLRSKSMRTANHVGTTFSQGKERASRRFSRAPKTVSPAGEDSAAANVADISVTPPPVTAPEANHAPAITV